MMAYVADEYSRGWGHITTRQNVQFHFVQLERVPELLRDLASVGLTTREACGDTVRNVTGCHLAGACPFEVLDISPWAEATFRHFLHSPLAQRLPRKFKINFSGCATDCGQAMFNDVGVIARDPAPRGRHDRSRASGCSSPAGWAPTPTRPRPWRSSRPATSCWRPIEAILRVFDHNGNRDNKLRARMKWLAGQAGPRGAQAPDLQGAPVPPGQRPRWPGGIPAVVAERGDAPAGVATGVDPTPVGVPVTLKLGPGDPRRRWESANVVRGVAKQHRLGLRPRAAGRHHQRPVPGPGGAPPVAWRPGRGGRRPGHQPPERGLPGSGRGPVGHASTPGWPPSAWPSRAPSWPATSSPAPAPTPATSPSPRAAGLADDIGRALEEAGLADVGGIRINISGCTNSCGQHHISDIGFHGAERRAHGTSAPGYQMLLGGRVGQAEVRVRREGAAPAGQAGERSRPSGSWAASPPSATPGERFDQWLDRSGGARGRRRAAPRSRRVAPPGGAARLLRRLRRDGPVRGRDRRVGVRDMTRGHPAPEAGGDRPAGWAR